MADNMENIIERVRKLHAKAESLKELGSLAEAETFAAGVQQMLLKYKLDLADIATMSERPEETIEIQRIMWEEFGIKSTSRRSGWIERLVAGITSALNCAFVIYPGTNNISVVGKPVDAQIATFLIGKLVAVANELATVAYGQEWKRNAILGDVTATRGYRSAWLAGFAYQIGQRMKEEYAKAEQSHTGLALIRRKDNELVRSFMDDKFKKKASSAKVNSNNNRGVAHGRAAANSQNLKANGVNAPTTTSSLTAGQKLLGKGE